MKAMLLLVMTALTTAGAGCASAAREAAAPGAFTSSVTVGFAAPAMPPVCSGAPKLATPLLVDLDVEGRVLLEASMQRGVVFVSYDCAQLRVLPYCHVADGGYEYAGIDRSEQLIQTRGPDGSDELSLVLVGLRTTTVGKVKKRDLTGSCEGATHFVQAAALGSFATTTGAAPARGSLAACHASDVDAAAPPSGCRALISAQLVPLAADDAPPAAVRTVRDLDDAPHPAGAVRAGARACALGDAQRCGELGAMYLTGNGVAADRRRAIELLDRACSGDWAESCLTLARTLSSRDAGTLRNPERAFRAARSVCGPLAGAACDEAISIAIETGHPEEAFAWSQAMCPHSASSCENLGDLYEEGIGTPRNPHKAREMWTKACGWGSPSGSRSACEKIAVKQKHAS